ncbi:hypothetical protein HMPREF6123_0775 [Oribacterium sinus F0268]|uniref:Uncharacterized protein n=1 Tax=Oribacterium sinus F0268 TaxID=585501 RepID=C2KWA6_9FIRM|nr:hypothetical protein HMPREF6123_0775 [Oribacterium sinus F0268]
MIQVTCRINFIEASSHKNYYSVVPYFFFDKKNRAIFSSFLKKNRKNKINFEMGFSSNNFLKIPVENAGF